MEQRVCERDETHIETRITDYSGPDYTLKPDKTKLRFEWTYGEPAPSQTITFKSTGRDNIHALTYAIEQNDLVDVSFEGLTLTVTPKGIVEDYESAMTFDFIATDANGETIDLSSPEMYLTCNVKKTSKKFNLIVEDGVATTGTLVGTTTCSTRIRATICKCAAVCPYDWSLMMNGGRTLSTGKSSRMPATCCATNTTLSELADGVRRPARNTETAGHICRPTM